jgi:ribA/ribD-fused uncharacterized protein
VDEENEKGEHASDDPDKFTVCHGKDDPISNFYEFPFSYGGRNYRSLEQGYQHVRAVGDGDHILATEILKAQTPSDAKRLSHRLARRLSNTQAQDDDVNRMRSMLQAKTRQCLEYREALRKSGTRIIVHSTYAKDKFWASGYHHSVKSFPEGLNRGRNKHGKLCMEMRGALLDESKYDYNPQVSASSEFFSDNRRSKMAPTCFHCGVKGHIKRMCRHRHKDITCDACGQPNHKRRYCTKRGGEINGQGTPQNDNYLKTLPGPIQRLAAMGVGLIGDSLAGQMAQRGFCVNGQALNTNLGQLCGSNLNPAVDCFVPRRSFADVVQPRFWCTPV